MGFDCTLCLNSNEWLLTSRFCSKCQRIKHLLNLYGDEVYKTLEEVLVRTPDQQKNKIITSIKPKIERTLPVCIAAAEPGEIFEGVGGAPPAITRSNKVKKTGSK